MKVVLMSLPKDSSRFAQFSVEAYEEAKHDIAVRVASRFTRGNVRAQKSGFLTQHDLDFRLDRVRDRLKAQAYQHS